DVRVIPLGRLGGDDARRLAEALLAGDATLAPGDATTIAAEAGGHPLFIDALVRHASVARKAAGAALKLDDALWTRIQRLDPAGRRRGGAGGREVVARAAGVGTGELAPAVSLLRATNLVLTQGARLNDAIEPFHDRVREALAARLSPEERSDCHARIATALELA